MTTREVCQTFLPGAGLTKANGDSSHQKITRGGNLGFIFNQSCHNLPCLWVPSWLAAVSRTRQESSWVFAPAPNHHHTGMAASWRSGCFLPGRGQQKRETLGWCWVVGGGSATPAPALMLGWPHPWQLSQRDSRWAPPRQELL